VLYSNPASADTKVQMRGDKVGIVNCKGISDEFSCAVPAITTAPWAKDGVGTESTLNALKELHSREGKSC